VGSKKHGWQRKKNGVEPNQVFWGKCKKRKIGGGWGNGKCRKRRETVITESSRAKKRGEKVAFTS